MVKKELETLPSLKNVELLPGLSGKAGMQFLRVPLAKTILEAETVEEAGAALDVAMAQLDELDILDASHFRVRSQL